MQSKSACLVIALAISSLAWSGSSNARRAESSSDAQAVESRSRALIKAELDADVSAFNSFLSDDYVLLYVEQAAPGHKPRWGKITKEQWASDLRTGRTRYSAVDIHNTKVYLHGDIAVFAGEYSQKGTEDGKEHEERGLFTETWAKRDGEWIMVAGVFP